MKAAKLPKPKNLLKIINESLDMLSKTCRCSQYVETIQVINGRLYLRIWSFKMVLGKLMYKEVYRETEHHKWIIGGFYFCNMAGWLVIWNDHHSGYNYYQVDDKLYSFDGKRPGVFCMNENWSNNPELFRRVKGLEYFVPIPTSDIIRYVNLWRKYKDCELLVKANLGALAQNERILMLSSKKKKALLSWIRTNRQELENTTDSPSFNFLMRCVNNDRSIAEQFKEDENKKLKEELRLQIDKLIDFNRYSNEIIGYLNKSDVVNGKEEKRYGSLYVDYIVNCDILGKNMSDRGVLFPHNLDKSHDDVACMVSNFITLKNSKRWKKIYNELSKYSIKFQDYHLVFPKSQLDLIHAGNTLHNCVGSAGYGDEMLNKKCIISLVYKGDDLIECCELRKAKKRYEIYQLRGNHNQPSEYHAEAEKLVNKFIRAYEC